MKRFWMVLFLAMGLVSLWVIALPSLPTFAQDTTAVVTDPGIPLPPGSAPTEFPKPLTFIFVVVVPFLIQYVKKWVLSPKVRWIIAVVASMVAGVLCTIVSGITLSFENLAIWAVAAYGFSQLAWGVFKYLVKNGNVVSK